MAEYLFLFTIGPVQDFIAAARRTRDLWAGSQLLSELSRTTAKALRDDYKATLIFPAPSKADQDLKEHDVVNRIMAVVATDDPLLVGDAVETIVRQRIDAKQAIQLKDIRDSIVLETFNTIPGIVASGLRSNAEDQIADLIEIYWTAVERTEDYQQDRDNLEAALAARKNTRDFKQPTWANYVPKSSIDGLRESVIDESKYPRGPNDPEYEQKIKQLFRNYGAKGAERLSGVDLLKRHYRPLHIHADFPSTSHFAALPLLARCKQTIQYGLNDFIAVLRKSYHDQDDGRLESQRLDWRFYQQLSLDNYDASILFESRLEEDLEGEPLKAARVALAAYRKVAFGNTEPAPYYALLHGDGDFMGKTIDALTTQGIAKHQAFSRALDTFASNVRKIVEQPHNVKAETGLKSYYGALVYSGGDDVLAFLPLHTAVQCARELAAEFTEHLGSFEYFDQALGRIVNPSLSIGVAICHHLEPLSDALNLAREAEKLAKKVPRKNALAITLSKRGAGDRTISGSWEELSSEHNRGFYDRLIKLTEWHRQGAIPDSAAYDLHSLIERLSNTLPPVALRAEAVRILKRKRGLRGQAEQANAALVALAETLPTTEETAKEWGVTQFANELIVTREFAKAQGFIEDDKQ